MKQNNNLNGLEYKQPEYRPVKAVEWFVAIMLTILIIICIKECNGDRMELTAQELANKP